MTQKPEPFLEEAIQAALIAGSTALEIYDQSEDYEVQSKADDSPLTIADRKSHEIIMERLKSTEIPILSEEGKDIPYEERKQWEEFWLVDPLDGTKEFIKKNGEFTINIAFIQVNKPVVGVIYAPVLDELYFGYESIGAYKIEHASQFIGTSLPLSVYREKGAKLPLMCENNKMVVVASRSHMSPETQEYIDKLKQEHGEIEFISRGSSLKLCMVAEGQADVYPRFGPTMEWDTAAGHAIALASGCKVTLTDEKTPLRYNKENLLNPFFIVKQ